MSAAQADAEKTADRILDFDLSAELNHGIVVSNLAYEVASELGVEEMLRTCSRMAVLRDGEKVGELEEHELSQSSIMKAIAGGDDKDE